MIMAVSDADKRAHAKWNAENMKAVATTIRREIADDFRAACEKNGTTMHQELKKFIENYISENK